MTEIESLNEHEIVTLIRKLSDDELHESAIRTAEKERKITLVLLRHLNEIERRHLYSKFDVSSLHAYCIKKLKFDDGGAGRRVSAARLLRDIPLIEEKILSGAVNLTSVAQAGIFFRKEARNGNPFSLTEKTELILELQDKSTREVDRILISNSNQPEIHFREKIIPRTGTSTEVLLHLDEETMTALNRLKEIWSHSNPHAKLSDLIKRASQEAVERHDPLKKIERSDQRALKSKTFKGASAPERKEVSESILPLDVETSAPRRNEPDGTLLSGAETASPKWKEVGTSNALAETSAPKSNQTKAEISRAVWRRDEGKCTFADPQTKERCCSKHFVEEDHIVPKAAGGKYTVENIRLRCRAHNQRHAIDFYGLEKMRPHLQHELFLQTQVLTKEQGEQFLKHSSNR